MTEYICTCDAICVERQRRQATANPQSPTTLWNGLRRLIEMISAEALETYRWSSDPQPRFSNGGARVLIRPDRIDLV